MEYENAPVQRSEAQAAPTAAREPVSKAKPHRIFHFLMRHKTLLLMVLIFTLARVPLPGKTGKATSLLAKSVTKSYVKHVCSQKEQPVLTEAVRRIVIGIPCPGDKDNVLIDAVDDMAEELLPSLKKPPVHSPEHHAGSSDKGEPGSR